jgi:hypothetical protein
MGVVCGFITRRRKYRYIVKLGDTTPEEERKRTWESSNETWQDVWEYILIGGLALEMIALPHHFIEAGKWQHKVEELRKENNELAKLGWSRSDRLFKGKFLDLIKQKPKGEVFIFSEPKNAEAMSFAMTFSIIMRDSGWITHGPVPWTAEKIEVALPGATLLESEFLIEASEMNARLNGVIVPMGHGELFNVICDSFREADFAVPVFFG